MLWKIPTKKTYNRWKTLYAHSPLKSRDVHQCHQLRASRKQREPWSTSTCSSEESGQKWSSWEKCSQNAIPMMWKQASQLCTKTTGVQRNGSIRSGQTSQNLKFLCVAEGSSFREGLESGTIKSAGNSKACWGFTCKFGTAFLRLEVGIRSETMVFSVLTNTGRC